MAKNLIIVESPAKVRTIRKFLGNDYAVEASVGHVRDLPAKSLGVDEDHDFTPEYQVIPGKQKVVSRLKAAADKAEHIYLAPDPDREGEAIAWHVAELIRPKAKSAKSRKKDAEAPEGPSISRIRFNEITPRAVREALAHPLELDQNLFNSQQARRILDRLVGYKLSPLLWKKVKRGISAGRVQSVALKLIVDRERERQAFVPEEYWPFKIDLQAPEPPPFSAELWKIDNAKARIGSGDEAAALKAELEGATYTVAEVVEKERKRTPPPPFITSTLQQDANRRLGFSAKKTMSTAQRLYEGVELGDRGTTALITYMRTDSVRIANEARDVAREYIAKAYGDDYLPPKPRAYKTKAGAQDAHEAIRPVDARLTPQDVKEFLPRDQLKLYTLIWQRFVASQMAPARFWDTTVSVAAGRTLWRAKGERLLFPGYLAAYGQEEGAAASDLPPLTQGMDLELLALHTEQKFTQPPPRFSEASLVKELEDKGIGRPSTYAAIISTLIDRDYARLEDKRFVPSELGTTVVDQLAAHFQTLMDIGFTAAMEDSLDKVAEGQNDWIALLKDFTQDFYPTLEKASSDMSAVKISGKETDVACPDCGKPMVIRFGKTGEFLGCSGYPDCSRTADFTRDDKGAITIVEREREAPITMGICPECGKDLHLKRSRTGSRFIACSGYPQCKHAEPFSTGVPCPREGCTGELVEKSSKRGKIFYSCSTYPKCDYATWDWPVNQPCPQCGSPILTERTTRTRGKHLSCPSKTCRYTADIAPDTGESGESGETE